MLRYRLAIGKPRECGASWQVEHLCQTIRVVAPALGRVKAVNHLWDVLSDMKARLFNTARLRPDKLRKYSRINDDRGADRLDKQNRNAENRGVSRPGDPPTELPESHRDTARIGAEMAGLVFGAYSHDTQGPPEFSFIFLPCAALASLSAANCEFRHTGSEGCNRFLLVRVASGQLVVDTQFGPRVAGERSAIVLDTAKPFTLRLEEARLQAALFARTQIPVDACGAAHGALLEPGSPGEIACTAILPGLILAAHENGTGFQEAAPGLFSTLLKGVLSDLPATSPDNFVRSGEHHLMTCISDWIEENLADPDLAVDAICRQFAVSRSAVYRIFSTTGGIAKVIRARRVERALHDLATDRHHALTFTRVARRWGFGNEVNFSRAVKALTGMSPRAYRAHQAACQKVSETEFGAGLPGDAALLQWLRGFDG